MQAELAAKAVDHGRHIFVYNNRATNQVIYSLSRSIANHDSLKQIPFNGKKSVPAAIRKDLWQPLATVTFPNGYQGESAYQKLREYNKRHQLEWRQQDGAAHVNRRTRGVQLMNQKANSIADIAKVLTIQETEIEAAKEDVARVRKEDEAAFETEEARAEELRRDIEDVRSKIREHPDVIDPEAKAAVDARIEEVKKTFEPRLTDVESWNALATSIQQLRKEDLQRSLANSVSRRELKTRMEDLLKEQRLVQNGHLSGVHGAALRQADFRAYGVEKDHINRLISQIATFHNPKRLRIVELESQLYVARLIQDSPEAAEARKKHTTYISDLETLRDALRTPKEQRTGGWQNIANELGLGEAPLNEVQQMLDTAKGQLIQTPEELEGRIKALSEAPVKVPRELKAALRKYTIAHTKGLERAAARQEAEARRANPKESNTVTDALGESSSEGRNSALNRGLSRVIAQNRGEPNGDIPSMEGVNINWANVLDAELAETWPDAVVHDTIGLVKHFAPSPKTLIRRSLADEGNLQLEVIETRVSELEDKFAKLDRLLGVVDSQPVAQSDYSPSRTNENKGGGSEDNVIGLEPGQGGQFQDPQATQSQGQEAAAIRPGIHGIRARMERILVELLLVEARRQAGLQALAGHEEFPSNPAGIEQLESSDPDSQTGTLKQLGNKVPNPKAQVEMTLVQKQLKEWMDKPPWRVKDWFAKEVRAWQSVLHSMVPFSKGKELNEDELAPGILENAVRKINPLRPERNQKLGDVINTELQKHPIKLVSGPLPADPVRRAEEYMRDIAKHIEKPDYWSDEQKAELEQKVERLRVLIDSYKERLKERERLHIRRIYHD